MVEDEYQNLFGGYIDTTITIGETITSNNCYVFSLRKNGEYRMKKYFRNKTGSSCRISVDEKDTLFGFGVGNNDCFNDIFIFKKDYSDGYCQQECYDYKGESFALTGKGDFNVKRIVVYQLN